MAPWSATIADILGDRRLRAIGMATGEPAGHHVRDVPADRPDMDTGVDFAAEYKAAMEMQKA